MMDKGQRTKPVKINRNQRATNAMRNNLNAASSDICGARRAQFILRELHSRTGMTQQALLSQFVNFSFENDPVFAKHRENVLKEWDRYNRKNR